MFAGELISSAVGRSVDLSVGQSAGPSVGRSEKYVRFQLDAEIPSETHDFSA